jgi:hypothetical protein
MATQREEDAIMRSLYVNDYQASVDSLIQATKLDRGAVAAGLKSLARYGYVTQSDLATYTITRLGIYYLEMNRIATTSQIEANERRQLLLLEEIDTSGVDSVVYDADLRGDEGSMSSNKRLLITSGLLEETADGGVVLTSDGVGQLKYLRGKYRPAPAIVVPVKRVRRVAVAKPKPVAKAHPVEEVAAAEVEHEEAAVTA